MSKISKFINKPSLFLKDMVVNRSPILKEIDRVLVMKKNIDQSDNINKTKSSIEKTKPLTFKYHLNFFENITYALHSGEGLTAGMTHLNLWLPFFIEAKKPFVIIVRDINLYNWLINEYGRLNVAFVKTPLDAENLVTKLPVLKKVFYPSSTGNNIHFVRFNYLEHIFIGHGDSDKASSANKALRLYDEVWTASQAHIDRFENSDFKTAHICFKKVGRPNLYKILYTCQEHWKNRNLRILYLPTWEGIMEEANYSSIQFSLKMLSLISKKFSVAVDAKYHPLTGKRNVIYNDIESQIRQVESVDHDLITMIPRAITVDAILDKYNIFICDISAVVTECIATNAPIFVYIPKDHNLNILSSNLVYEDYCYTFSTIEELLEKIEEVLSGNDILEEKRKLALEYFVGKQETLDRQFIKELQSIE